MREGERRRGEGGREEGERKGRSEGKRKEREGEERRKGGRIGGSTSCSHVHIIFSTDRASHHRHQPRVN